MDPASILLTDKVVVVVGAAQGIGRVTADLFAREGATVVATDVNLKVTMLGGEILTFNNVAVGWHPIRVTRVWTSTTATNIIVVWR